MSVKPYTGHGGPQMIMAKGQVFRCENPRCEAEIRVEKESIYGFTNPICCCGAEMKLEDQPLALGKVEATPEVIALLNRKP